MVDQDQGRVICRGHPSYVWRAGQERRLCLIRQHISLENRTILDVGCGLGMYTQAFSRFSPQVYGVEVELERAVQAGGRAQGVAQAVGERLPFADDTFDIVFSHEVLEHVDNDLQVVREMVRVTRPDQHMAIFVPNRLWPWETHGIHWRGRYHAGNIALINYLPDILRDRLAWHVRTYTRQKLLALFQDLPVKIVHHRTIYPGFDNLAHRHPRLGALARSIMYGLEAWPVVDQFGLSHFLIVQKTWERARI